VTLVAKLVPLVEKLEMAGVGDQTATRGMSVALEVLAPSCALGWPVV